MRVAALYDIHGNLPALEAVLIEVEREGVDAIVVGGDIAAGPPQPREVVELLFDVIAWSQQKVLVSLSLDAAVDPDALTPLDFDDEGHAVVGPASSSSEPASSRP